MTHDCRSMRDQMDRYRDGSLSGRAREDFELHLDTCKACASQVFVALAVADVRRAVAHDDNARDGAVYAGIVRGLGEPEPGWSWVRTLSVGFAVAAVLLITGFVALRNRAVAPREELAAGWLTREEGVTAWRTAGTDAGVEAGDRGVTIALRYGTLLASFDKTQARGPLRVTTPFATAIVRGTVFAVRVSADATTVSVDQGRVEVVDLEGRSTMVEGGHATTLERTGAREVTAIASSELSAFARFHGDLAAIGRSHRDAPADTAVAPTPAVSPAGPSDSPRAEPTRAARDRQPSARASSRGESTPSATSGGGAGGTAPSAGPIEKLESAIARPDTTPADREELLYELANAYRAERNFKRAVAVLSTLHESSISDTARLAGVERARLLAHELDKPAEAQRILKRMIDTTRRDAIVESAWLDLCVVQIEQRELDSARTCLDDFLRELGTRSSGNRARELRRRLDTVSQ